MTSDSVAFDRAADFYDQTRRLSPAAMTTMIAVLAGELEGRGRCLEIGVGTGRMALPLLAAGVPIMGVDLSGPMLNKLIANAGGTAPFELARADATALPFSSDSFGGALACWVLHLIPAWPDALAELVRVVQPGGVVLVSFGFGGVDPTPVGRMYAEFRRIAASEFPGANGLDEVDEVLIGLGARSRTLEPIIDRHEISPGAAIDLLEQGVFSFTWPLTPEERSRAAAEVREWAKARWGSLDDLVTNEYAWTWRAYDLP